MQRVDQATDAERAIESPEFAVRFGRLLTTTRRRSRRSIDELAARPDVGFDARQLRQLEHGATPLDESIVADLCGLYSADVGRLLPSRRPVAIVDGQLSSADTSVGFSPDDPSSVLVAYLQFVVRVRHDRTAPAGALRRADIVVIADYLGIDGSAVVERLAALMHASPMQRRTMAMLFASGAIVIGLVAGGSVFADSPRDASGTPDSSVVAQPVVATPQPDRAPAGDPGATGDVAWTTPPTDRPQVPASPVAAPADVSAAASVAEPVAVAPSTTPATAPATAPVTTPATTAILEQTQAQSAASSPAELAAPVGTGAVVAIDQAADIGGLAPATRLSVPEPAPAWPVASEGPTPNQSGCNPDPSEAVMSVDIPDISYECPVYAGGQSTIDAGYVTLVTDAPLTPLLATTPGQPGTLWLAGHRSTHGAAFADVPDLADGALVTVTSDGATATYRIVGRAYVEVRGDQVLDASGVASGQATWVSIIRDDLGGDLAPRLVLQTCEGANFRWMIYADLVT